MDLISNLKVHLSRMTDVIDGMKILLLDEETIGIISLVFTQTELFEKEIYLVDKLENQKRHILKNMNVICFFRPSMQSVSILVDEIRNPKYNSYYLFASNTISRLILEKLADADEFEVVKQIQEIFVDYFAVNNDLFSLNIEGGYTYKSPIVWDAVKLERTVQGLVSLLLSLKKRPVIRYEKNSPLTAKLSEQLQHQIQLEGSLFDFKKSHSPNALLLILDRKNDPVTPLLSQWTYQAMVHELVGIKNNRVNLSNFAVKDEFKDIVLSPEQDPFYQKNMLLNFGDLGANIKTYLDDYQAKSQSSKKIDSIDEMKSFVEQLPEFRKLSANVTKHVALITEISHLVSKYNLMPVGELEQKLACSDNHASNSKELEAMLQRTDIDNQFKIRLVILYALRYEKMAKNCINDYKKILSSSGIIASQIELINRVLKYAGGRQRQAELFSTQTLRNAVKRLAALRGVDNIYTQHHPAVEEIITALLKKELKEATYPFSGDMTLEIPDTVILFFVGGTTYEEARYVSNLNAVQPNMKIILGGTTVHNSQSFLEEISGFSLESA